MKIIVIRHAKINNPDKLIYGNKDIEVEKVDDKFYHELSYKLSKISHIYSSPLKRCKYLAIGINQKLYKNLYDISFDERLKEQNFGVWEGLSWDEVDSKYSELNAQFWQDEVKNKPPCGESYHKLYLRLECLFNELRQNHDNNDKILIIAHGGVIRAISAYTSKSEKSLYQKLKESLSLRVDYLSMFEFEI